MQVSSDPIVDLVLKRHADELRATWQARILSDALTLENGYARPRDKIGMCILSILAHSFDGGMPTLLRVVFPGFQSIGYPFLCSAAKVAKSGQVMADLVTRTGAVFKRQALFKNERDMERVFRTVADRAKLIDADRVAMFDTVKRWVVCDYRLDPTMDPRDPDAKRLVH